MSTFGNYKTVKTRKSHRCETCQRTIPIGTRAINFRGMYEDDWQNFYMCEVCWREEVYESGEPIEGYEFSEWMQDQMFALCPKCKTRYDDWDWSENKEDLEFECSCGEKWTHHVGFEVKQEDPT